MCTILKTAAGKYYSNVFQAVCNIATTVLFVYLFEGQ